MRCRCQKEIRRCFKHEKARLTLPRKLITDFFHNEKGHFTAEEVFEKISKKYPGIGLATIYRTLNNLSETRFLNKFQFGEEKARYEISENHLGQKHHHHLVCSNCGKIIEYNDFIGEEKDFFSKIGEKLSKKHNFLIKGHSLYFYGLCISCKNIEEISDEK